MNMIQLSVGASRHLYFSSESNYAQEKFNIKIYCKDQKSQKFQDSFLDVFSGIESVSSNITYGA